VSTWHVDRGAPFNRLVTDYERSAFRWECQGSYREDDEVEPWRRWRAGDRDTSWMSEWVTTVRRLRAEGKTFARVRMLTDPLTDYLRWMLEVTPTNIAAGEDIRWISEAGARAAGAPGYDFYLLDDRLLVTLRFDEHGVSGAEVTDDPAIVQDHCTVRDRLTAAADPHTEGVRDRPR
jgi:hypothetical protein